MDRIYELNIRYQDSYLNRKCVTTNFGDIEEELNDAEDRALEYIFDIIVTDALSNKFITKLDSNEELEAYRVGLEMAFAWKGLPVPGSIDVTGAVKSLKAQVNKKNIEGAKKAPTTGIPPIAIFALGAGMQDGVEKYGAFNWRDSEVTASVFYRAMLSHLMHWYGGEDKASDSHVHHLGHLMAGAAIILDAELQGCFNDDRPKGKFDIDEIRKITGK